MRICFDASLLATPTPTGVERAIARTLRLLVETDKENEYVVCAPDSARLGLTAARGQVRLIRSRLPALGRAARILWQQSVLPIHALRSRAHLLHAPAYVAPVLAPCPVVLTVYDTLAVTRPDLCKDANALHYRLVMPRSVRRAARIIAPTRHVREQVLRAFGVHEGAVRVIPPPLREFTERDTQPEALARVARTLPDRFILFLGNIEPKKDVATLVSAFADLRRRSRIPHKLVLAGRWAWKCGDVERAIRELGVAGEVVRLGYIPDADLPALYRLAELFVFPSIEEGFGMPPLEAMALGAPVIAGDAPALRETLADAALFFRAGDPAALSAAMDRILHDAALRRELAKKGAERARAFRPDRIAADILQVYREAAGL